ncbi:unnamed protein product [Lasius platythorax]|uniref:Uncharacterized protein n=1 Tax=Lasius platythorax TaxID=488582 RepID=A0AAV2N244_9HYME
MVSTRFRKLELLPTSDRALMHSGISVIAQCSHERRVNLPNDNGHPFAEAQRRSPTRSEGSPGAFTRLVYLLLVSCYPHPPISTQTDQECFGIPRFPLSGYPSSFTIPPPPETFVGTLYPPVLQLREGMLIWYAAGDP